MKIKLLFFVAISSLTASCGLPNKTLSTANRTVNTTNSTPVGQTPSSPKIAGNENLSPKPETDVSQKQTSSDKKGKLDEKITSENFDKIKLEMTLEEVGKIFADDGMKVSDLTINGRHTEIYMWSTDDFKKKILVTLEKGKVIEKEKKGFE